jgi:signal transduction histidine kinase
MRGYLGNVNELALRLRSLGRGVRWTDLRTAGVVAAIQIGATVGEASHQHAHSHYGCWWGTECAIPRHLDAFAFVLLACGPLALLLRRRNPSGVLLFTFAATLLYATIGYPQGPVYLSLVIAFATAVIEGRRTTTRALLVPAWALFLWLPYAVGNAHSPSLLGAVSLAAWLAALLVGCEAFRGRRERMAEVRRRRELQARRRADEERLRIARELHDVLAHSISLINVQSGVALHLLDEHPEQARTALSAINEASGEALHEVRSVLGVLRGDGEQPPRGPTAGLASLDELISRTRTAGIEVALEVEGEKRPLPTSVDLAAFRIVQESLTNVVRHSSADAATVHLDFEPDALAVQIDDDGSGPGTDADADGDGGSGIPGMRERVAALGGELQAGAGPSGGFRVRARLPIGGSA